MVIIKTGKESSGPTYVPSAAMALNFRTLRATEGLGQVVSVAIYFYFIYLTPLNNNHFPTAVCASLTHQKK